MLKYILFGILFILVDCVDKQSVANCSVYLENLANSLANFTSCSVLNSRPITICENCVYSFINVLDSYQNISQLSDTDGKCIDDYINLDRLEIVLTLYENSHNLWNRAKCYECFKIVNGRLTANASNETIKFNKLLGNFAVCLNKTEVNETNMCNECMEDYTTLDDYYRSISNENEKIGVCMDIVDLMNGTRGFWSSKCCKFRQHNESIFLISIGSIVLGMLAFYILAKVCTEKNMPTVFKQSRFAHVLHHSSSVRQ